MSYRYLCRNTTSVLSSNDRFKQKPITITCRTEITENIEDTKGVITRRKSKKDLQRNGQKKNNKRTENDKQSTTQKTKEWAT